MEYRGDDWLDNVFLYDVSYLSPCYVLKNSLPINEFESSDFFLSDIGSAFDTYVVCLRKSLTFGLLELS